MLTPSQKTTCPANTAWLHFKDGTLETCEDMRILYRIWRGYITQQNVAIRRWVTSRSQQVPYWLQC